MKNLKHPNPYVDSSPLTWAGGIYFFIEKLITYASAMSISSGVTGTLCLSYNEFLWKKKCFPDWGSNWKKSKIASKFTFYCYAWILLQLPIGYLGKKKKKVCVSFAAMVLIPFYRACIWGSVRLN